MNRLQTILGSVALSVLIGSASGAQAQSNGVAELLRQGAFWQARGRGDLAEQAYRRVLQIDPGNAAARAALAGPAARPAQPAPAPVVAAPRASTPAQTAAAPRSAPVDRAAVARTAGYAALERGNMATAENQFEAALRIRPNDSESLGGLGLVRLRAGRFAEARDLLTRASARGSESQWAEALGSARFYADLQAAEVSRDVGELARAEAEARRLAQDSDASRAEAANTLLADILVRREQFTEAAALYEQLASSGSPANAEAVNNLQRRAAQTRAVEAAALGDLSGAERLFQDAIAAAPADPWLRYEFGRFLLNNGRRSDAVAIVQPLESSVSAEALYATALLYNQAERRQQAAELMRRIPASGQTPPMRQLAGDLVAGEAVERAQAFGEAGRVSEALGALDGAQRQQGLSVSAQVKIAETRIALGDASGAAALAARIAAAPQGDADADAYLPVVALLARTDQDATAVNLIRRVGGEGVQTPATRRLYAVLAANSGDRLRLADRKAEAFEVLQSGWSVSPNDVDILGALARLYQSGGLSTEAVQVYGMLLQQKPDDISALSGVAESAAAARDFGTARAAYNRVIQLRPEEPETYLTAATVETAAGNRRAALAYLRRAESLYGQAGGLAQGQVFTSANPFAGEQAVAAVPANPFAPATLTQARLGPTTGFLARTSRPTSVYLPNPVPSTGSNMIAVGAAPAQAPVPFSRQAPVAVSGEGLFPGFPRETARVAPVGANPALQRIYANIEDLSEESAPYAEVVGGARVRSGEEGLSDLLAVTATGSLSTALGNGRLTATVSPVVLDAGVANASSLARFGSNPTAAALAIISEEDAVLARADAEYAAGVSFGANYEIGGFKIDVGSTPLGFERVNFQGGISWAPKLTSTTTVRAFAERRPVTDSVLSYGGTIDPVTGQVYGSVMKTGGGVGLSYDREGSGLYADVAYRAYRGENVPDNSAVEGNLGAYLLAYRSGTTTVTAGANLNYQAYEDNQNFFTFGHGGYFSPQSFVSVSLPISVASDQGAWSIRASAAPGLQTFQEDSTDVFPTLDAAQGQLDALKLLDNDVLARFDSTSNSGFGFAGSASAFYRLAPSTSVGGEISVNTFGDYNEFVSTLRLKQTLGGW